jgi:hypothetical protein
VKDVLKQSAASSLLLFVFALLWSTSL